MNNGLLVRVAIDLTAGGWNGPCDDAGGFCFVPMGNSTLTESYDPAYRDYRTAVLRFLPEAAHHSTHWPHSLPKEGHFDPDFKHLSYGDCGRRAARIRKHLGGGDFLVFYAGLRSVRTGTLCYSLIGFFGVERILSGPEVPRADWSRNAHTRDSGCADPNTIVVFARPGESGRLLHHIPIGSYRDGAYRVEQSILSEWGGLGVKNGYLQRSRFLPAFTDGSRFLRWFRSQKPELIQADNPS